MGVHDDGRAGDVLPVADPWFVAQPMDEHITLITEPHVHPLLSANIWHVRGRDRDLLVDTGVGVAPLKAAFSDLFDREPIVVVTHGHLDHQGSAHEFQEVWAHALEDIQGQPGTLESGPLLAELLRPGVDVAAWGLPELLVSARPDEMYRPLDYRLRPPTITRLLDDGDRIDLGDRSFTVLHLPGHTPGSIALHDERNGVLFTGDVIYDDELIDNCVGADIGDYAATMRRLMTLEVGVVHAGHEGSFDQARLRARADDYLAARSTSVDE